MILWDVLENWSAIRKAVNDAEALYSDGKITLDQFDALKADVERLLGTVHGGAPDPAEPFAIPGAPAAPNPDGRPPAVVAAQEALLKKYASWLQSPDAA